MKKILLPLLLVTALLPVSCKTDKHAVTNTSHELDALQQKLEISDRKNRQLDRDLKNALDLQDRLTKQVDDLQVEIALKKLEVASSTLAKIEAEQESSKVQVVKEIVKVPTPVYTPVSDSLVPTTSNEKSIVWWTPPTPNVATKIIKNYATEKWKDQYDMVEYEINKQTKALENLRKINNTYNKTMKNIIASAVEKWGTQYDMVEYEINKQSEALQRLNGK